MNKNSDKSKADWWKKIKTGLKSLGILVGFIGLLILWGVWFFPDLVPNVEKRGQWGDSFGFVTALFTGLAFAILIRTLHVQQEELALQRQELEGQKKQLQKQNFESSFFQLLGQHNENVKSMVIRRGIEGEYFGRECFGYMFKEFKDNYDRYKGAEEQFWTKWQSDDDAKQLMLDWINDRYEQFFAEYEPHVGYYFRHLYNVIKFVQQSDFPKKERKKLYTNFIRAQLSNDELRLLFYNCLSKRGTKFKKFVEKYALLEDVSSLINEEHRGLYKKSAFGESV